MRVSAAFFSAFVALASAGGNKIKNKPDADGKYTLTAPGIKAQFIEYGARLTNLWVQDKNGKDVDVVLGYDTIPEWLKDGSDTNTIPGRYVNRIGNATYKIDGKQYFTDKNDGENTLHSGNNRWSFRNWTVSASDKDSITFDLVDPADAQKGFPTKALSSVTYKLKKNTWDIKIKATSPDAKTPLMLTQHVYYNLDAYRNPAQPQIWNHTLHMPFSKRYLEAGQDAVPTGKFLTAAPGSVNDFASRPGIFVGETRNDPKFSGNCGADGQCEGYNGQWLIERPRGSKKDDVVLTLGSPFSGIKAELRTDQVGIVIYSCNWSDGKTPLKSTQGTSTVKTVGKSSCIAIEPHDLVDGINHPEWGRVDAQITGPGETYKWHSSWTFGKV